MKPTSMSAEALFEQHRAALRWEWVAGHAQPDRRFDEAAAPLEQLFAHGLPETCDRLLGAAITRVRPETLAGGSALAMPRMAERFLLRVRGRGVGTPIDWWAESSAST